MAKVPKKFVPVTCDRCGIKSKQVNPKWARYAREQKGISQREVAERFDYSNVVISLMESGQRRMTPQVQKFYEKLKV